MLRYITVCLVAMALCRSVELAKPRTPKPKFRGLATTYIRWGRSTCPATPGTEIVYSGKAAGSRFDQAGGGANYLCMPLTVQYADFQPGVQINRAFLYGLDYAIIEGPLVAVNGLDPPCALCQIKGRSSTLMIPGRLTCPKGWTVEYSGYLLSTLSFFPRTTYVCVDEEPEAFRDSVDDIINVGLFSHVEASCSTLPCPPYEEGKEVTCVLCSL